MALLRDITGVGNIGFAGVPTVILGTGVSAAGGLDSTIIGANTAAAGSFTTGNFSGNVLSTNANARFTANATTGTDVQFRMEENGVFKGALIWDSSAARTNIFGVTTGTAALSIDASNDVIIAGGAYLGGTAAANLLDDYEEGTFTPTITTGSGAASYTSQLGEYRKIGSVVIAHVYLVWSKSTLSGNLSLDGLPFVAYGVSIAPTSAGTMDQFVTAPNGAGAQVNVSATKATLIKNLYGTGAHTSLHSSDLNANTRSTRLTLIYPAA